MKNTTKLDWLNEREYPFKSHFFSTSVGEMHYVDEGKGEPIVFVHGNPSWSFEFRNLIKELSKTHRCIAPDHIGFGLSDKPVEWSYLPTGHSKNFEQFMETLDLNNITMVVGDWGGPIGLSYALKHPEKIRSLVITNTWLWSVESDLYYQAFSGFMGGGVGRWLIKQYNFFANNVVKAAFGNKNKLTPVIHRHYLMPLCNPQERKGNWTFPKQIIGSSQWLNESWDKRHVLASKDILLAWGMKDIAFRKKELDRWMGAFPNAKVIQFEDAGHFVSEEKSEELIVELKSMLNSTTNK